MNIVVAVAQDDYNFGAKWMHIVWSDDQTETLKGFLTHLTSGGTWKHVQNITLDSFCQISLYDCWPFAASKPIDLILITEDSLELSESGKEGIIATEFPRVVINGYGMTLWMVDYKHSASWECSASSYSIDVDNIRVSKQ